VNASTATVSGLEVDLMYLAASGLTVRANLGILDASYDDFLVDIGTPGAPIIMDFSHLKFRRAPELTASLGINYGWEMGSGLADIQAGWNYLGKHDVDFANKPELRNKAQHLVNASFNYDLDSWRFSIFGRNLLDEDGYGIGFDVAGLWSYASTRPPRTFGVEVGYSFGD
jgi:iron complex outermembrane receptor protein